MVNGCLLCKKSAESNQHIFLHCETTRSVQFYFLNFYKLQWFFHDSVRSNIWEWRKKKCENSSIKNKIWDLFSFAICWAMWNEGNARLFNGQYKTQEELIDSVKISIFNCCFGTYIFGNISINSVLNNWEDVTAQLGRQLIFLDSLLVFIFGFSLLIFLVVLY